MIIDADGIFSLILVVAVLAEIIAVVISWRKYKLYIKVLFGFALSVQLLCAVSLISSNWGAYPWGRASAFQTANDFMLDLKSGNYYVAFEKLTPNTQKLITEKELSQSRVRPVSWQLDSSDRQIMAYTGKSVFSDGAELPIEIKLRRMNYEWRIYDVRFGEFNKYSNLDSVPRLNVAFCCESENVFDSIFPLTNWLKSTGYNTSQ